MNRKQEQADLVYQLGLLLAPLQDIVDHPDQHNEQTRARACASVTHDAKKYCQAIERFIAGEPGRIYEYQGRKITGAVYNAGTVAARYLVENPDGLPNLINDTKQLAVNHLLSIPTDVGSEVFEADNPYQAYCKLKAYFETTNRVIVWADPYMGSSLFHRYLNYLPESVAVTLVTMERPTSQEYLGFLDVSRLYAAERGPTHYRLVVETSNHDRWLRCDNQLYHLGGSAKDAGGRSPFTISKLDPAPENFKKLDDLIANGRELLGPSNPVHP